MFLVLWEFEVKPGYERRFEMVYGPDGDWVRFFRTDPHYHKTRLVYDSFHPSVYLTLDFWESRRSYEAFTSTHRAEYTAIDSAAEELTLGERLIGQYELAAPVESND